MPYGSSPPAKKPKKVVVPNKNRKRPGVKKGQLTDKQQKALKSHGKHHTLAHIKYMTMLMKSGSSFAVAHKKAMTDKGK